MKGVPVDVEPVGLPFWYLDAACKGLAEQGDDPWFDLAPGAEQVAKQVCGRCPVASPCLDYALRHRLGYGIWGGTNPQERLELRRKAA